MKHTCPKCGHKFEQAAANQKAGGKARWKGTKKKYRSSSARAAALARWKTKKADGPQNNCGQPPEGRRAP